jgi:Xaa-Pro aminopeptidase
VANTVSATISSAERQQRPLHTELPFPVAEYETRRERVRAAMAGAGIDVLYITSPANILYLTGYEAIWYPNRLPLGVALTCAKSEVVVFDWSRHRGYVENCVLCDDFVLFDYGSAPATVAKAFAERGWSALCVGIEWSSPNPGAPIMTALATELQQGGARIVSGDWIVDRVRLYKSAAEMERIYRAAAIADSAMLQLQCDLRPGMTEREVSAHLHALLAQRGSAVAAMAPLVNSGPTAWMDTHAFPSARQLEIGDVVSVDCCAVIDSYHANLGRTFAIGTPNAIAQRLIGLAAGSFAELQRHARLGEGPELAAAATDRYVRERIPSEQVWWIGGYALGLALPPSWVGLTYLANDGIEKCSWLPGYVSNFENVLMDKNEGFEAGCIDTIAMTATGLELLTKVPRELLLAGV